MKAMFLSLALVCTAGFASAQELDDESGVVNAGQELSGTVVIRIAEDGEVSRLEVDQTITEEAQLETLVGEEFESLNQDFVVDNELDIDAGQSSWYYHWGYRYYFYRGFRYRPYYVYRWRTYRYYYYAPRYRWWW